MEDPFFNYVRTPIQKLIELLFIWFEIYFLMHLITCSWMRSSSSVFSSLLHDFDSYYESVKQDPSIQVFVINSKTYDKKAYNYFVQQTLKHRELLENQIYKHYYQGFYLGQLTISTIGYGDYISMPDLTSFHDDYTFLAFQMLVALFTFNLSQAQL